MQKRDILIFGNDTLEKEIVEILKVRNPGYLFHYSKIFENAIALIKKASIDLIVIDSEVLTQNLKETIKKFKSQTETKHIPIVLIINQNMATEVDQFITAGVNGFISKPYSNPDLISSGFRSIFKNIDYDREVVRLKQIELTENTIKLVENQNFLNKVRKELLNCQNNKNYEDTLPAIIQEIDIKINQNNWKTFHVAFESVHGYFTNSLLQKHPNLTKSEIKLAILIRLGLSTKEMSDILCYTIESIKVARCRLRRKLNLNIQQMLETYLITV